MAKRRVQYVGEFADVIVPDYSREAAVANGEIIEVEDELAEALVCQPTNWREVKTKIPALPPAGEKPTDPAA